MITAAVIDMVSLIVASLLDAIPETQVPPWISSAAGFVPQVFTFASSMGVWFPWSVLSVVLAAVVATWLGGFAVKVLRIIISHVSGGGGSAA